MAFEVLECEYAFLVLAAVVFPVIHSGNLPRSTDYGFSFLTVTHHDSSVPNFGDYSSIDVHLVD